MEKFAIYRECMKNHAANLGSYATDGCREYFPSTTSGDNPPELCAACGCHRSYHRRVESEPTTGDNQSRYPRTNLRRIKQLARLKQPPIEEINGGEGRRRKSKFTAAQREAMREFAERLGWTLRNKKGRQEEIRMFCDGIGVTRYLFKTWVNNNKKYYLSINNL